MSYHAEAAADLEAISRSSKLKSWEVDLIRRMIVHLDRASVFKLPVNGTIFPREIERGGLIHDTVKRYGAELRLPYSEVILEFASTVTSTDINIPFSRVACIASDMRGVGVMQDFAKEKLAAAGMECHDGVFISGAFYVPTTGWIPNGHSMVWFDDGRLFAIPNFSESPNSFYVASNDLQLEIEAVTMLICALSCSNVSMQSETAPEKVNKKRAQAKKRVIRDHHILVIGASKSERGEQLGGTHASPRVHLRRGHIRRLDKKNIWVNACVVGNKRMGILTKDYDIRERA